ncbi:hypothetical protein H5410_028948 [Solanum commersonii]|uniref:Uncharacterized protein n=1 Tax=Solanum commersonii TaxID=4109 RepID=A0A9J5Z691_SOLCO|nr:hypothetical protein H5410_028948 [Solanum commersonii]
MARFVELMQVLEGFTGISTKPDTIRWKHVKDDKFSVNRTYKKRQVCSLKTGQNLGIMSGRVWLLPRSNVCLASRRDKQPSISSLQGHLTVAVFVPHLTETSWLMPEHTAHRLSLWIKTEESKRQKNWWRIIPSPSSIWWTIWKERNEGCFEDRANTTQKIKWNCIAT